MSPDVTSPQLYYRIKSKASMNSIPFYFKTLTIDFQLLKLWPCILVNLVFQKTLITKTTPIIYKKVHVQYFVLQKCFTCLKELENGSCIIEKLQSMPLQSGVIYSILKDNVSRCFYDNLHHLFCKITYLSLYFCVLCKMSFSSVYVLKMSLSPLLTLNFVNITFTNFIF